MTLIAFLFSLDHACVVHHHYHDIYDPPMYMYLYIPMAWLFTYFGIGQRGLLGASRTLDARSFYGSDLVVVNSLRLLHILSHAKATGSSEDNYHRAEKDGIELKRRGGKFPNSSQMEGSEREEEKMRRDELVVLRWFRLRGSSKWIFRLVQGGLKESQAPRS